MWEFDATGLHPVCGEVKAKKALWSWLGKDWFTAAWKQKTCFPVCFKLLFTDNQEKCFHKQFYRYIRYEYFQGFFSVKIQSHNRIQKTGCCKSSDTPFGPKDWVTYTLQLHWWCVCVLMFMLEQVWGSGVIKSAGHWRLCLLGVSALRKYIMGLLLNSGLSMHLADDELVSLLVVLLLC